MTPVLSDPINRFIACTEKTEVWRKKKYMCLKQKCKRKIRAHPTPLRQQTLKYITMQISRPIAVLD